jgi:hypothetical protein
MSYDLVRDAIRDRISLTATYDRYVRFFSPHLLGKDSSGAPVVVAYQYGGGRRGGLPAAGAWACFTLAGLSNVTRNADKWIAGPLTPPKPVHVLKQIDIAA